MKKKQKIAPKTGPGGAKGKATDDFVWDATRQSRRTSTVKHKTLVRERLKDAEQRKVSRRASYLYDHHSTDNPVFWIRHI